MRRVAAAWSRLGLFPVIIVAAQLAAPLDPAKATVESGFPIFAKNVLVADNAIKPEIVTKDVFFDGFRPRQAFLIKNELMPVEDEFTPHCKGFSYRDDHLICDETTLPVR